MPHDEGARVETLWNREVACPSKTQIHAGCAGVLSSELGLGYPYGSESVELTIMDEDGNLIPMANRFGWTSDVPNPITCKFLNFISERQSPIVIDIGAGFGVASLPVMQAGAFVIVNDLSDEHLNQVARQAEKEAYLDRFQLLKAPPVLNTSDRQGWVAEGDRSANKPTRTNLTLGPRSGNKRRHRRAAAARPASHQKSINLTRPKQP